MELFAGLDEVGMGALAGPLVLVVYVFDKKQPLPPGVRDSKRLSPAKREQLVEPILEISSWVNFGFADAALIDKVGMSDAWNQAALMALEGAPKLRSLVIDGVNKVRGWNKNGCAVYTYPRADSSHWEVSAASILAKVMRDREMTRLGEEYPCFQWDKNAGYGSNVHLDALRKHGPCFMHRKLYLRKFLRSLDGEKSREIEAFRRWMAGPDRQVSL